MRGKEPSKGDITPTGSLCRREQHRGDSHYQGSGKDYQYHDSRGLKHSRGLYSEGKIHGITGIGGATGSLMVTEVMRSLPFGFPKFLISSTAALPGLSTRYIGREILPCFIQWWNSKDFPIFSRMCSIGLPVPYQEWLRARSPSPRQKQGKLSLFPWSAPVTSARASFRRHSRRPDIRLSGFMRRGSVKGLWRI